ncbi:unnamed protein product [Pleuronectes platessa]|uniref:Uncharacterized protein n=1 Tax=Pleuronectes platessa TaxID=8262 RepID=A0A9N7YGI1_PLEPL|nr:unnamed protein product [Pleuronectes platessa]
MKPGGGAVPCHHHHHQSDRQTQETITRSLFLPLCTKEDLCAAAAAAVAAAGEAEATWFIREGSTCWVCFPFFVAHLFTSGSMLFLEDHMSTQ